MGILHIYRTIFTLYFPIYNNEEKDTYKPRITSTKSESSVRVIPLNSVVKEELKIHRDWQKKDREKNHLEMCDFLFLTSTGRFYDKRNVRRALNRYYDIIGVARKPTHAFRHTAGTNWSRAKIPIQVCCGLLGHADISVTAKYYVNITPEQKQEAVDALLDFTK